MDVSQKYPRGEVVYYKCGGPPMIIINYYDNRMYMVAWFNTKYEQQTSTCNEIELCKYEDFK